MSWSTNKLLTLGKTHKIYFIFKFWSLYYSTKKMGYVEEKQRSFEITDTVIHRMIKNAKTRHLKQCLVCQSDCISELT